MSDPEPTLIIGLEVHVQLKTDTKLFCRCTTLFGRPPNSQVCPVCLGLPGALPVLNRRALELAIQTGLALGCEIRSPSRWDRKNYFYADLPKGYQISQYDQPICVGGALDYPDPEHAGHTRSLPLIRAHLEEDAGKSVHDEQGRTSDSRIDLNRAGTPLLEIVTEPALHSPDQAKAFLTELRLLLTHLGVSDCNMQEGSLRVDANVNLQLDTAAGRVATPIVEIKNLNSFRAVERALEHERQRQWEQWLATGQRLQDTPKQTRGWDDVREVTLAQREKEDSSDYRYFPDPDLLPVVTTAERIEQLRRSMPLTPAQWRKRLVSQLGLSHQDAQVLVGQGAEVCRYLAEAVDAGAPAKRLATWLQQDVQRVLKANSWTIDQLPIAAEQLAALLRKVEQGDLETRHARELFQRWLENPAQSLESAISALGIESVDGGELVALCTELLEANPDVVEQVRKGNLKAVSRLIGQAKQRNPGIDPQQFRVAVLGLIDPPASDD
jgi:aspartyl-tRNA(Asn)/glutamyl-tRNA(Gln) amidotransferase subunit B